MWRLKIGNRLTGYTVRQDDKYPSMWRVHTPNGRISDMVNLTRAKDAAMAACHLGGDDVPRWEWDPRQSPNVAAQAG